MFVPPHQLHRAPITPSTRPWLAERFDIVNIARRRSRLLPGLPVGAARSQGEWQDNRPKLINIYSGVYFGYLILNVSKIGLCSAPNIVSAAIATHLSVRPVTFYFFFLVRPKDARTSRFESRWKVLQHSDSIYKIH